MTQSAKRRFRREFRLLKEAEREEILSLMADFSRIHGELKSRG